MLRAAACEAAQCCLPGRGLRFFDVQQDFAEAWQQLQGMIESCRYRPQLRLRMGQNMFPFLTGCRRVHVCRIELFFEAECPLPGRSHEVEFLPGHHMRHPHEEQCECEIQEFTCIASAEYPCPVPRRAGCEVRSAGLLRALRPGRVPVQPPYRRDPEGVPGVLLPGYRAGRLPEGTDRLL